jgi:hypothetical protein
VETENGERLRELPAFHEVLAIALRAGGHLEMLKWIDPYGDTAFNQPQRAAVRADIDWLQQLDLSPAERRVLLKLVELLDFCEAEPHRYLKFYGD